MKTLKFRAWDDGLKQMFPVGILGFCEGGFSVSDGYSREAIGKYPLMQFTGFIDKNGKEVYEGDIVQYKFEFPKGNINERIYKVEFDGCAFRTFGNVLSIYEQEQVEVIANIYKNPNNIEYER